MATENQAGSRFYPNPFRESFNIDFFNTAASNNLEVTIYDMKGVLLYRKTGITAAQGNTTMNITPGGQSLPPGSYIARLQVNGIPTKIVKLVKL